MRTLCLHLLPQALEGLNILSSKLVGIHLRNILIVSKLLGLRLNKFLLTINLLVDRLIQDLEFLGV